MRNTIEEYCVGTQDRKLQIINNALDDDSMNKRLGNGKKKFNPMSNEEMKKMFYVCYKQRKDIARDRAAVRTCIIFRHGVVKRPSGHNDLTSFSLSLSCRRRGC